MTEPDENRIAGDAVYQELLTRTGEEAPRPRLAPTRQLLDVLGDPQRLYPIIHITGTNGKTSTARIIESILRAHGLRVGLFTSPHLVRFNERIMIDGEPISDGSLAANWSDIKPYVQMVDRDLATSGESPLTYFELLSALAFASFADAPVDVAVIEVGMGGEWDSTNVGDGQVAVFTPISLDHTKRLGSTVAEIARTKSGIIKPLARVVSSHQLPEARAELERAIELTESTMVTEGDEFRVIDSRVVPGGQRITVQGLAAQYPDLLLPLAGRHQAQNASVAIAAVESFIGGGSQPISVDILAEGLARAVSPGRLETIGTNPTVLVDAAHNPGSAQALDDSLDTFYSFDQITCVLGILADKDAHRIVELLNAHVTRFIVTTAPSDRTVDAETLAKIVTDVAGANRVETIPDLNAALDRGRQLAAETTNGAALVTGSITLVGDAMAYAARQNWRSQ